MSKNIFKRALLILPLLLMSLTAQEKVDAIENARQAKAAAERAAAAAEAATGAAVDAAAAKASKDARAKIVQGRKDEEARKQAELDAALEAELDAAAAAAAKNAKRKMAEELGLEYEDEVVAEDSTMSEEVMMVEEVTAKESLGWDIGVTGSLGFINGGFITNVPIGASLVIETPFGFSIGENLNFNLTLAAGSYNGEGDNQPLDALFYGLGLNAFLFDLIFSETHVGNLGDGLGLRNFSGVSLERLMKKTLDLPVNILFGGEGFVATKLLSNPIDDPNDITENSSFWGGLGLRINYSF